jgi:D-alanyl-D-alanine carboxypeptidase/D-alanyl-D-alanine-endopeptidase (penicillin-binding protein 4)
MTAEAGRKAIAATLEEWGLDPSDVLLADGSGLSRYNLVTPAALAAVLTYVYRADHLREAFQASLPLAGREGTIAGRMKGTAAEANARAKSGAFGNTRTLSGYVWSGDGEPLAFSIMTNNIGGSNGLVEAVQDAVVVRLASFSRR